MQISGSVPYGLANMGTFFCGTLNYCTITKITSLEVKRRSIFSTLECIEEE